VSDRRARSTLRDMTDESLGPQAIFDAIAEQLLRASSDRPVALESYEARFSLLLDVLLGHPRVRGTGRPRDYPLTPGRMASLRLATALTCLRVGLPVLKNRRGPVRLGGKSTDYRFYDFVATLRVLPLRAKGQPDVPLLDGPVVFAGAMLAVLWHLARQLFPVDARGRLGAAGLEAVERVTGTLALNETERRQSGLLVERGPDDATAAWAETCKWSAPTSFPKKDWLLLAEQVACLASLAEAADPGALAALLTPSWILRLERDHAATFRSGSPVATSLTEDERDRASRSLAVFGRSYDDKANDILPLLATFASHRVHRVEFQNRNIQSLLNQAKVPAIARGISAWALRATALLRDELSRESAEGSLRVLSDSDAKTVLVGPAIPRASAVARAHHLLRPQASDLLVTLPALRGCAWNLDDCTAFERLSPNLYLRVSSLTLLELAVGSQSYRAADDATNDAQRDRLTEPLQAGAIPPREAGTCWGLYGEQGIGTPPWYEKGRDDRMRVHPRAP
jgi:hypothetical protein